MELAAVAPAFVEVAHRIVWAVVASVEPSNRPRSRILHPIWQWDGERLVGWIATSPTPRRLTDLAHSPFVSVTYWNPTHDTATAECEAELFDDDETCEALWHRFAGAPSPVGYDPAIVPGWKDGPTSPAFLAMQLRPWRLRVMPGTMMLAGKGQVLRWPS